MFQKGLVQNMNTEKLTQNMIDTIKEWQIKIGYQKEAIGLYYPADSLKNLLELPADTSLKALLEQLSLFSNATEKQFGKLNISNEKERICLQIPEYGVTYIHENIPDSEFLKAFLKEITTPGCTLNNMRKVFYTFSDDVVEVDLEQDGLGTVFYFSNDSIDSYVYCLEFDAFGATYHRFSKEDYEALKTIGHKH